LQKREFHTFLLGKIADPSLKKHVCLSFPFFVSNQWSPRNFLEPSKQNMAVTILLFRPDTISLAISPGHLGNDIAWRRCGGGAGGGIHAQFFTITAKCVSYSFYAVKGERIDTGNLTV
jgi:hypothetical protein